MEIKESRQDTVLILAPVGRIDSNSAGAVEAALMAHAGEARLLVDLTGVEYISSAGLRVFLVLARKVKAAGGRLALCGMGASVKQVFDLAGFTALFTLETSVEQGADRLTRIIHEES